MGTSSDVLLLTFFFIKDKGEKNVKFQGGLSGKRISSQLMKHSLTGGGVGESFTYHLLYSIWLKFILSEKGSENLSFQSCTRKLKISLREEKGLDWEFWSDKRRAKGVNHSSPEKKWFIESIPCARHRPYIILFILTSTPWGKYYFPRGVRERQSSSIPLYLHVLILHPHRKLWLLSKKCSLELSVNWKVLKQGGVRGVESFSYNSVSRANLFI